MSSTFTSTADMSPVVGHTFTRSPERTKGGGESSPDVRNLEALRQCSSISSLRAALAMLCRSYGELQRLDIVPAAQGGRRQALCFMRLQSPEQEHSLMRALGIGRFGGELVLVVNLASAEHERAQAGPQSSTVSVSVLPVELGKAQAALEFQRWSGAMADRPTQAERQH